MLIKVTLRSYIRTYELLVLGKKDVDNPLAVATEDVVAFLKKYIRNWEGYSYASQEILSPNVLIALCVDQINCLATHNVCIIKY